MAFQVTQKSNKIFLVFDTSYYIFITIATGLNSKQQSSVIFVLYHLYQYNWVQHRIWTRFKFGQLTYRLLYLWKVCENIALRVGSNINIVRG